MTGTDRAPTGGMSGGAGRRQLVGAALALLLVLTGCGGNGAASASRAGAKLTSVTIAMGYVANVQFAPFYVAQAKGYYRQAGLDVHLRYGIEPDLLSLASQGKVAFVDSGGDEVLAAGAQGLHVRYVMTQFSRFPAALFALQSTGIGTIARLRGRSIGVPGRYGASYVGLLALLARAGIPTSAVTIKTIGFTQVESVAHRRVDAAVGYANNDAVFLRAEGYKVQEFDVYRWANLAGAGIAASDSEIAQHPQIVRALVRATQRGMAYTLKHPSQAFQITLRAVPGLAAQSGVQRQVLQRSLAFWQPEGDHPLGWADPTVWQLTARLLYRYGQIPHAVSPGPFYTNQFVG